MSIFRGGEREDSCPNIANIWKSINNYQRESEVVGELKEGEEVLRYSVLTVISSKGREEENNWADTGVLTVQSHNQHRWQ